MPRNKIIMGTSRSGGVAYANGAALSDNPYSARTKAGRQWKIDWEAASLKAANVKNGFDETFELNATHVLNDGAQTIKNDGVVPSMSYEEVWVTRDGRRIEVGRMELSHLQNTLRMFIRQKRSKQLMTRNEALLYASHVLRVNVDQRQSLARMMGSMTVPVRTSLDDRLRDDDGNWWD